MTWVTCCIRPRCVYFLLHWIKWVFRKSLVNVCGLGLFGLGQDEFVAAADLTYEAKKTLFILYTCI